MDDGESDVDSMDKVTRPSRNWIVDGTKVLDSFLSQKLNIAYLNRDNAGYYGFKAQFFVRD